MQLHRKMTWTPKRAARRVTPFGFLWIIDFTTCPTVVREGRVIAVQHQTKTRQYILGDNLVMLPFGRESIIIRKFFVDGTFMPTEVHGRPQLQDNVLLIRDQVVIDMDGVLTVKEQHMFFHGNILEFKTPNRQAVFQAELSDVIRKGR